MRPIDSSYDRNLARSLDRAAPVRAALMAGETVDYATVEDLCDDLSWRDITRDLDVEDAGEGYRLTLPGLLRATRARLGLAQPAMADRLGVPMRTYQSWEAGQVPQHPELVVRALRDVQERG